MTTRRYITIAEQDNYFIGYDVLNRRYAVFQTADHFVQQVSRWYIYQQCAWNKLRKLTEDKSND